MHKSKKLILFFLISISANYSFSKEQCADIFLPLPLFLQSNQLETKPLTILDFEKVDNPFESGLVEINRYKSQLARRSRPKKVKPEEFNFNASQHVWDAGGHSYFYKYEKSLDELKKNYPQLVNILYHPGVFYRLDHFLEFIRNYPHASLDEAVNLYTKHLGYKVYYRSLYLDKVTARSFMKKAKNILANQMYFNRKGIVKYPDFWYKYKPADKSQPISFSDYAVNLNTSIENHVVNRTSKFVLSVTEHPEVALAVGQMLKSENPTDDKRVYLAKILVPVINTIPNLKKEDHDFAITIKLDNEIVLNKIDVASDKLESFMFFGIDRRDIIDFSENDTPYTFEMVRKSNGPRAKR